jgi:hypothetical protein
VPRPKHLDTGAKLLIELPPEPLVLGPIQGSRLLLTSVRRRRVVPCERERKSRGVRQPNKTMLSRVLQDREAGEPFRLPADSQCSILAIAL